MAYERAITFNGCVSDKPSDPVIYCSSCLDVSCKYNKKYVEVLDDDELNLDYGTVMRLVDKSREISRESYDLIKQSGFMFELYPDATGDYEKDKFLIKR